MTSSDDNERTQTYEYFRSGSEVSNYTIARTIGVGGMGVVYLARDRDLERDVALKFLSPNLLKDDMYIQRFRNETLAVARLNHPKIVTIYHVGEFNSIPFFAMEYIEGNSLRNVIGSEQLSLEFALKIIGWLCDALSHAHAHNIVHADLKPENIILTNTDSLKVLDFGLATGVETASLERQKIEGTIHYMSPEHVSGTDLSCASDLFSLGIVLYEMLTGIRPFEGDSAAKVIYAVLHEDPRPVREIRHDIPSWLESLLMSLLAKDIASRPASMNELKEVISSPESRVNLNLTKAKQVVRKNVTVLDLLNMSNDRSWDYFCIGFTEDIVREVSRRTDLLVSSKPSEAYARDIREVFKRCKSDYVVSGTLMKWKEDIKLSISLYGSGGSKLCFGEQYSGETENIFKLLTRAANDLARAVARETNSSFTDVSSYSGIDATAYDYYLKGRSYYNSNKPEMLDLAEQMFNKALSLEPDFADAHTGLSDVHTTQYLSFYDRSIRRIRLAKKEAEAALEKDPILPDAHRSLGRYFMSTGDLVAAEKELLRSVEIAPKYAIGYRTLAWLKEMKGDHDAALHWAMTAHRLAPTDLETLILMSLIYMDTGRFNQAISTLARTIELGPDYGRAYYYLGTLYTKLGVLDLALENLEKAVLFQGDPNVYIDCGYVLLLQGRIEDAELRFKESIKRDLLTFMANYYLGLAAKLKNENSVAEKYLIKSVESAEKCIKDDAGNDYARSFCAMAYTLLGRVNEAIKLLDEMTSRIDEIDGDIVFNIARSYSLLGDMSNAEKYRILAMSKHAGPIEKEIALDPHFDSHRWS